MVTPATVKAYIATQVPNNHVRAIQPINIRNSFNEVIDNVTGLFDPNDLQVTADNGDTPLDLSKLVGFSINVQALGAPANGTDYDDDAFTKAIANATALGLGSIEIPMGNYRLKEHHLLVSNVSWRGAGKEATIIYFDTDNTNQSLFYTPSIPLQTFENIGFYDMTIDGGWSTSPSEKVNCIIFDIYGCTNLTFHNVKITNGRAFAFSGKYNYNVSCIGCDVIKNTRDGFNWTNCSYVKIIGCNIWWCGDDAIASHLSPTQSPTVHMGITVMGCTIIDSNGIKILGGNNVTVSGNTLIRCRGQGIWVGGYDLTSSEGRNTALGITITGNTILDQLNLGIGGGSQNLLAYIIIASYPSSTGGGIIPALPGTSNSATGTVYSFFPYMQNNGVYTTTTHTGGQYYVVSGNTCARTLPDATLYSQLNVPLDQEGGLAYTKTGFADRAIAAGQQSGEGIRVYSSVSNATISDNTLSPGQSGINFLFETGETFNYQMMNILIKGNNISRTSLMGIGNSNLSSARNVDITITGDNFIDADPLFENGRHSSDGTWTTGTGVFPAAININYMQGVTLGSNHYRNTNRVISADATANYTIVAPQVIHGKPATTGISATNGGVGQVLEATRGLARYVMEETDPNSANFRKPLAANVQSASAMPSTGLYVKGAFVDNTNPTIDASNMVINGWLRLTTNSNHVSGTDWAICRTSTVSPAT